MTRRRTLCFAFVIGLSALFCSETFAQGYMQRGPARRAGKFLGAGWGSGNHWQNPAINPDYYNPFSEHNSYLVSQSPEYLARFGNEDDRPDYQSGWDHANSMQPVDMNGDFNGNFNNGGPIPFERYAPTDSAEVPIEQLPGVEIDSSLETELLPQYDTRPNGGNGQFQPGGNNAPPKTDRWWEEDN